MAAIWKDYTVNLGVVASMRYRIRKGGITIFEGVAHRRPGDLALTVRINEVCADYLDSLNTTFVVERWNGSSWVAVETVSFSDDWSYDAEYEEGLAISDPVRVVADNQVIIASRGTAEDMEYGVLGESGWEYYSMNEVIEEEDMTDFQKMLLSAGCYMHDLKDNEPFTKVTILDKTFRVARCCQYTLVYKNAYGGVDTLPIEGTTVFSDAITRHSYEREYDNTTTENRGKTNYANEVKRRVTFHTGWLSDEDAARMHHLLESTEVWMMENAFNNAFPLVLTQNTCEYKTYKTNGCQLVNYTIEAEISQNYTRR